MLGCLTMPLMRGKDCTRFYRTFGVVSCLYLILARLDTDGVAMIQPVWATVTAASLLHGDFLAANDNGKHPRSRPLLSTPTWSPPPSGTTAISVDGAFIQAQGAGISVVARDSAGIVLGGFAQHSVAPGSSASAEAAAVLAGLHFAYEQGSLALTSFGHSGVFNEAILSKNNVYWDSTGTVLGGLAQHSLGLCSSVSSKIAAIHASFSWLMSMVGTVLFWSPTAPMWSISSIVTWDGTSPLLGLL
ncbi:hypothetical protein V6N11_035740 [Hibiscus sabdariffa]|uniref:RNase H type-1 domain-containing protein n=1 Tax=Hibiscus sabdariffa TaxID=183260 RepID=A0ABR2R8D6_9ROSI